MKLNIAKGIQAKACKKLFLEHRKISMRDEKSGKLLQSQVKDESKI